VLFAAIHLAAVLGSIATPFAALAELAPLLFQLRKYGASKGLEMYVKALALYTSMAAVYPLRLADICRWLKPPKAPCTRW